MPLFCIITTCFNATDCIKETIESILVQDFKDFEYIVMDGGSSDDTLKIADSYKQAFSDKGISYHVFSEKDHGIYEGMNHGIRHASGDYINFMNAGDRLYNPNTLSIIAKCIPESSECEKGNGTRPDIIYGDAVAVEFDGSYKYAKDLEIIERAMPFSHQSVFASRKLLTDHPFNESLRISADYDFLLTAYKAGMQFTDCGTTVCIVTLDGLSSYDLLHAFEEKVAIQRAHGIDHFPGKSYDKKIRIYKIKQFVMDHFPKFIIKMIRKIQRITRKQNEHFE